MCFIDLAVKRASMRRVPRDKDFEITRAEEVSLSLRNIPSLKSYSM
jgi:hypothetical protein